MLVRFLSETAPVEGAPLGTSCSPGPSLGLGAPKQQSITILAEVAWHAAPVQIFGEMANAKRRQHDLDTLAN